MVVPVCRGLGDSSLEVRTVPASPSPPRSPLRSHSHPVTPSPTPAHPEDPTSNARATNRTFWQPISIATYLRNHPNFWPRSPTRVHRDGCWWLWPGGGGWGLEVVASVVTRLDGEWKWGRRRAWQVYSTKLSIVISIIASSAPVTAVVIDRRRRVAYTVPPVPCVFRPEYPYSRRG